MHFYWWPWGMGLMGLLWVLVVVALIVIIFRAAAPGHKDPRSHSESAEEILKKRYARGEVDREEFDRMLEDIRRR